MTTPVREKLRRETFASGGRRMEVLLVGAGVVGTVYGTQLADAGHRVVSPQPGSGTSMSPFWYQSNSGPTWPFGSAMQPSREVEKLAVVVMVRVPFSRW